MVKVSKRLLKGSRGVGRRGLKEGEGGASMRGLKREEGAGRMYTVKKMDRGFPVPSREVTSQTLPGRE